jgi:hypothetical protein
VPFLFFAAIALIGAAIHLHRDKQPRSSARTLDIFLVWWMVVAVGVAADQLPRRRLRPPPLALRGFSGG